MIKFLLLSLVLLSSLLANKVVYLSYEDVPSRVVKGEIFSITIKSLSTVRDFHDIVYNFSNYDGVEILSQIPKRVKSGKYFYDTFSLLSTKTSAKLPDIEAILIAEDEYNTTTIFGDKLNIIALNPKQNFSNIIANNFELVEYKTTSYDKKYNIIVFVASAKNCKISNINFKNVYKQGIESINESYTNSRITYFIIVDKKLEHFSFSYFNLSKNKFSLIDIPIIVDEDSVTTQSDLKPKDQSKERLKMGIAAGVALLIFIFMLLRRKYIYFLILIIPLAYIAILAVPQKDICIKKGTQIKLLPVSNGTIFETTSSQITLSKEFSIKDFVKVKMRNEKTGWVKNEDICSY